MYTLIWCLHVYSLYSYLYVYACMCVCICVYMCVCVCLCAHVHVCVMTSRNAYLKVASDIFDITKCGYYLRVTII